MLAGEVQLARDLLDRELRIAQPQAGLFQTGARQELLQRLSLAPPEERPQAGIADPRHIRQFSGAPAMPR